MLLAREIAGNDVSAAIVAGEDEVGTVALEIAGKQQFGIGNIYAVGVVSVRTYQRRSMPMTFAGCGHVSHFTLPTHPSQSVRH